MISHPILGNIAIWKFIWSPHLPGGILNMGHHGSFTVASLAVEEPGKQWASLSVCSENERTARCQP